MGPEESLVVFQGKGVRRVWHGRRWHFSIIDVVGILRESTIPRRYRADLKNKLQDEGFELYDKIVQLTIPSTDGKMNMTDCADTEVLIMKAPVPINPGPFPGGTPTGGHTG